MKLYIITRKDLSHSQQAVQAGHAVADFCIKNKESKWQGHSLIYLVIKNEEQLMQLYANALHWNVEYGEFREPYWNNQLTAIALFGGCTNDKLKHLSLMGRK